MLILQSCAVCYLQMIMAFQVQGQEASVGRTGVPAEQTVEKVPACRNVFTKGNGAQVPPAYCVIDLGEVRVSWSV